MEFKQGNKIKITRPGLLNGVEGVITEIRYTVDCSVLGIQYCKQGEMEITDNAKLATKATISGAFDIKDDTILADKIKAPQNALKTPTKKVKATVKKDVKIKRPYNRKAK